MDVILERELAEGKEELIAPAAEITGVDVKNDGDEALNIVDNDGLYMQIEEGTASCISMAA